MIDEWRLLEMRGFFVMPREKVESVKLMHFPLLIFPAPYDPRLADMYSRLLLSSPTLAFHLGPISWLFLLEISG
jgi:hypothetical protein